MDDRIRMTLDEARPLVEDVLSRHGLGAAHVDAVADIIMAGERDGGGSHGIYRLLLCVDTIKAGKVSPDAEPSVQDVAPALVRVDARGGFAPLAFRKARPLLVEKAKRCGIAALGINHCFHFAALWPEVEALARDGLAAFAFTPSHAWVAPFGGRRPLFGTNPLAFGWPRPGRDPFVFDFATSAVARGEIELHRRAGKPIPLGWGVDPCGEPTTDPAEALAGAMLPFGGHKGSALAAMIELIAGPLIGDMTSMESLAYDDGANAAPYGGELVIAIDPAGFLGTAAAEHLARAEQVFEGIVSQGARLPSLRRYEARRRSQREGVHVDRALLDEIYGLLNAEGTSP
jgi:delta1-piperideine-2-carboxylate reductase